RGSRWRWRPVRWCGCWPPASSQRGRGNCPAGRQRRWASYPCTAPGPAAGLSCVSGHAWLSCFSSGLSSFC
ncbi:UPF0291 protein SAMEA3545305_01382, partial [Dysosmobacter welbionis]